MSTDFNVKTAQCPGCGASLEFKVGSSRLIVCDHCKFVVARTDRGLESLGKVADLVPTGAKITLGIQGKLATVAFRVVGRTQLKWAQGVWDEWYLAFDNGRWGWLAEAQGRYYLSFPTQPQPVPAWSALRPGKSVPLGNLGRFVASDLKRACYVAACGDLTGAKGAFATLDYGAEGDEADLYLGREVDFDSLGLDPDRLAAPPKLERIKGQKLTCPKCSGPLELKLPDQAMRVVCPFCGALLDTTEGALKHLSTLKQRSTEIPMGARGKLFGVDYLVLGWLERKCTVEAIDYFWQEYLLYDERTAGYRFLVDSDGHWSFVTPVPAGEITEGLRGPVYKGVLYRSFASVAADVSGVKGEFYWAVALGERVTANDYVAPPEALSEEKGDDEVNWSHAVYLEAGLVKDAFKLATAPKPPRGVGMMQPNPWGKTLSSMWWTLLMGLAGAIFLLIFLSTRPSQVLYDETFTPAPLAAILAGQAGAGEGPDLEPGKDVALDPAKPENGTMRLSQPFRVEQAHRPVEVEFESNVNNTWTAIGGALVNQDTSEVTEFELEEGYYQGVEDGESWSEGSREETTHLSALDPGQYVLRLETAWESGKGAPQVHVKITSGGARFAHFLLALASLLLWPALAVWRNAAFEKARWEESNLESGTSSSEDDD